MSDAEILDLVIVLVVSDVLLTVNKLRYTYYIFLRNITWYHKSPFFSPETRLSPWPGKQFFNKECGSELAAGVMYIIYFHASKNGTNLPDVKTYCNKMEQILAKKSDMFQSLQTSSNNKHFKDITLTLKCVKMQTEKYMGAVTYQGIITLDSLQERFYFHISFLLFLSTSTIIMKSEKSRKSIIDSQKSEANLQNPFCSVVML